MCSSEISHWMNSTVFQYALLYSPSTLPSMSNEVLSEVSPPHWGAESWDFRKIFTFYILFACWLVLGFKIPLLVFHTTANSEKQGVCTYAGVTQLLFLSCRVCAFPSSCWLATEVWLHCCEFLYNQWPPHQCMLLCWSHTTPASILLDQPLHSCNCCSEWTLYTVPISCPSVKQLHAYTFLWRVSLWADPLIIYVSCCVSPIVLTHLVILQSEWRTPTLCVGNDWVNVMLRQLFHWVNPTLFQLSLWVILMKS